MRTKCRAQKLTNATVRVTRVAQKLEVLAKVVLSTRVISLWLDDGTLRTHVRRLVKSLIGWLIDLKPPAHDITGFPIEINSHSKEFDKPLYKSLVSAANNSKECRDAWQLTKAFNESYQLSNGIFVKKLNRRLKTIFLLISLPVTPVNTEVACPSDFKASGSRSVLYSWADQFSYLGGLVL